MRSLNAFYALRPRGQTNLHGDVLPRQPSSRRRKETVAFGGFNSEIKPCWGETADKTGWRLNETTQVCWE